MTSPALRPLTLDEIRLALQADSVAVEIVGDGAFTVDRLVSPAMASATTDLVLAIEPAALEALARSPARAAVIASDRGKNIPALAGTLLVQRPHHALATLVRLFDPAPAPAPGIHPSAVIEPTARIDEPVTIGPFVHVGAGAVVGRGSILMAHVSIGAGARLGAGCRLHPGARVGDRVSLGDRVILQHNASIGADGFSYATPERGSIESARATGRVEAQNTAVRRIDSIGTVTLGDDVEVGANSSIDRGTLGATSIGRGTKIDNLVQVGHNCTIGENCLIAGQVGISGSCRIGDRVVLAGQVGVADHVAIGDDAIVMAGSGVGRDVAARRVVLGSPAMPREETLEQFLYLRRLKRLFQEVVNLRGRVDKIDRENGST